MSEARWHDIPGPIWPAHGEQVLVRHLDAEPLPVIFRLLPVERWESPDGVDVYQFKFFAQWRRL